MADMPRAVTQGDGATFQLERFEWAAPDRLEIAGTFAGIDAPSAPPTLVIRGVDRVRRLTGASGGAASDGETWTAAFHWSEPPVPFQAAELELGDGLSVTLPAPAADEEALPVHGSAPAAEDTSRLRADLLAALDARAAAEEAAQASADELGALRERVAALEGQLVEVDALREELERTRSEAASTARELERARAEAAEAEQLRARLDAVREALEDGR